MSAAPDSSHVGRHDDELLRRFVAARDAGDDDAMRHWWHELVATNYDRVAGMVSLEARGHLSADERQDAVQAACLRLTVNMIATFHGTSMGEWINALRRLVTFACIDVQRKAARISKHERHLDEPRSGDDDRGRYDDAERRAAEGALTDAEERERDQEDVAARQAFLDWAVPQLTPRPRQVFELMRQGKTTKEIMQALDISENNVHVSSKRALARLRKLSQTYEP